MSNIGNIIDGLKGKSSSSYGFVHESEEWKMIAGVRTKVDKDGKVIDEKDKKLIEKRLGKTIDEASEEDETKEEIDEDEWKTMHGAHILVDDKGGIKAGGPKEMRKKASKEEIKKGVEDANKKSEKEVKKVPYAEAHKQENLDHLHKNSDTAKKYNLFKESDNPYGVKNVVDVDKKAAAKLLDDVADKYDKHETISDDEKECLKALCMAGTTLGKGKVFSQDDKDFIKKSILEM